MSDMAHLVAEARQFPFFALVRLLEHLLGTDIRSEPPAITFEHTADLAFPTHDVASLAWDEGHAQARMAIQCFGLVGTASPMPLEWTEDMQHGDDEGALRAFCDVFHDRAIRVLFDMWKTRTLEGGFDREGRDPLSRGLRALVGVDAWAPEGTKKPLAPMVALGLADHQRGQPQSIDATSAEQLLRRLYPVWNVRLRCNVPRIVALTRREQSRLGSERSRLGIDVFCGHDAEDTEGLVRVHVGPLDGATYASLMPGEELHAELTALTLQLFSVEAELEAKVADGDAPPCRLGAPTGARLGLDTYCTADGASESGAFVDVRVKLDPNAVTRTFVL
ncbi:type VI secretion system baseplate subunit TssG [Pendulispora albinea]|uniref:Type VI secretion system baseplate subunit TssG n=1 Tax=Pendulispora albinea TaxID=2741071 RepID=A0ABZ2LPC4_9BACT